MAGANRQYLVSFSVTSLDQRIYNRNKRTAIAEAILFPVSGYIGHAQKLLDLPQVSVPVFFVDIAIKVLKVIRFPIIEGLAIFEISII